MFLSYLRDYFLVWDEPCLISSVSRIIYGDVSQDMTSLFSWQSVSRSMSSLKCFRGLCLAYKVCEVLSTVSADLRVV